MTAALEGGEWSAARPDRTLSPGEDPVPILQEAGWTPGPVCTGGKSRPYRDSIPDPPARNQSLYRLSYPAHTHTHTHIYIYVRVYILARVGTGVKALCYKTEGRCFDPSWCILPIHYDPGFDSASNRNEYHVYFLGVKAAGA